MQDRMAPCIWITHSKSLVASGMTTCCPSSSHETSNSSAKSRNRRSQMHLSWLWALE